MIIVTIFIRLARKVFLGFAVALILFWLPIEVLYRLSSWALFMPVLDMVKEVAMMILLLALSSASLALLAGAIGVALRGLPFLKTKKIEEPIGAVVAISAVALMLLFLLELLKTWLQAVTGITVTVGAAKPLVLLLVIGVFVVLARKYGLITCGNSIQSRLDRGRKAVLVLIVGAGLTVGLNGIVLHDYHKIKPNPVSVPRAGMPNVILLSIDTLTAEDMSLYGYHLPTTPKLEDFAQESYVFDNFFSSSNWTTPSVASLISGLYPISSGVHKTYSYFLKDDSKKNLGQALKENGYQTAAIVANSFAHPLVLKISDSFSATTETPVPIQKGFFNAQSIGRDIFGIENYWLYCWLLDLKHSLEQIVLSPVGLTQAQLSRNDANSLWPPELVFDRTLSFFNTLKQPNLVWTHIFPPHEPFLPAVPFKYQFGKFKAFSTVKDYDGWSSGEYFPKQQAEIDQQRLRYDEFILDTDFRVGNFLDKLKAIGHFDDSIIIITADHGESFSKNFLYHGGLYLHQPLIHIPLMIHLPGQKTGKRIPFYAGQVDLLPTIMELLDLPIPKWAEGESLKAIMLEGKPTSQPKFSMNLDQDSRFAPPRKGTIAVMKDGWKLVRYLSSGKEELYHLAFDPGETNDLASIDPRQAQKMRELIYARFKLAN